MFGNNPYQRRMPQYGGFNPYQQVMPQGNGGFSGGFGGFAGGFHKGMGQDALQNIYAQSETSAPDAGNILPTNSYPRMPSPYPGSFMPSPYRGGKGGRGGGYLSRDSFDPIRGGGMGQIIPTNMPFRDPGYGSPVRTQNLISAMSGPQDLMSDRRMGSLNMLDQLRSRPDPYYGAYGGGGYNPIRTADFQDGNRNGVDDRDEGGGGIGGFYGGGYGSGMAGRNPGLGGPGDPSNPYAPPPRLNETAYGVDEIGNALTEESYNYILNNSGVDADGDGKINSEEFDAYSSTEDAKNYMPGELPDQLRRITAPEDSVYGTRYDGKAFTEANFGRFTNKDKDGVGSADRDSDNKISEDEWLDWMLSKGATEGYEKDWTTKIRGALSSGIESGRIDSKTKTAAVRALKETEKGNYKPDYNIETGETRQEIKDRWARQDAEKAKNAEGSDVLTDESQENVNQETRGGLTEEQKASMIAAGVDPAMMSQILGGNFNFGFAGGGPVQTRSSMEDLIAMAMQGTKSNMPQNMLNGGLKSPSSGGQGIERLMRNLQARKLQQSR